MKAIVIDDRIDIDRSYTGLTASGEVVPLTLKYLKDNKGEEVEILGEKINIVGQKEYQTSGGWFDARAFELVTE